MIFKAYDTVKPYKINKWGKNVYVKVPVALIQKINFTGKVIKELK